MALHQIREDDSTTVGTTAAQTTMVGEKQAVRLAKPNLPIGTISATNTTNTVQLTTSKENQTDRSTTKRPIGATLNTTTTTTTTNINRTNNTNPGPPRNVTNRSEEIAICGLNVCGLNSKLDDMHFIDHVEKYDIFCASETKVSEGYPIKNYTVFNLEIKSKEHKLPGVHGIQVYIKEHIARLCSQINDPNQLCKCVIWIKIADKFILGSLYIPYEGSKFYHKDIFENLTDDINTIISDYDLPLMLIGDFNSRTSNLNDIMLYAINDHIDESSYKYLNVLDTFKSLNIPIVRSNIDTKTNNNGRDLIQMCLLQELCIVNGRIGSDKNIGKLTFDEKSTIDYVICTPDLLPNITNFTIDKLCTLLSDKHNPINVNINLGNSLHQDNTASTHNSNINDTTHANKVKCKWENSKKEDYQKN